MPRNTPALAAIAITAFTAAGALGVTSRFDANNEGWFIANVNPTAHIASNPTTAALPWDSVNGLTPGSVRAGDLFPETWIGAPASFLGNKSALFGQPISFAIFLRTSDGIPYGAVALRGASITLYWTPASPPLNVWQSMSQPLVGAGWHVNSEYSATIATDAQMLAVLTDLRGLYIRTEWTTGPDDTNVDTITLGTPPVCNGDVNHDGSTNISDFNILASHFGQNVILPNTNGDLNGDHLVNIADFNILASNFGCSP